MLQLGHYLSCNLKQFSSLRLIWRAGEGKRGVALISEILSALTICHSLMVA